MISIHVLRMEDDHLSLHYGVSINKFQSTSSAWRTTCPRLNICRKLDISIHVLRMEDDNAFYFLCQYALDFNPRPPHGGRRLFFYPSRKFFVFQSTSSAWRTTTCVQAAFFFRYISIHVLRMEDDDGNLRPLAKMGYFNPRPPHGGRLFFRFICRFIR